MRISEKNSGCAVRWRLSETRFASHTAAPHLTDDDDDDVGDGDDEGDADADDEDGDIVLMMLARILTVICADEDGCGNRADNID